MRFITNLMCLFGLLLPLATTAQEKDMAIVTGFKTGTYYAVGKDIVHLAETLKLPVKLRETKGSIENLELMATSGENAALGIVQADVLSFLLKSSKPKSKDISERLRAIMPLFKEEIHILARKEIKSLQDLNGKRIVVGSSGSGSMMTSINLFSLLGIKPERMFQVEAPEAVVAVLANRADAMLFVGGAPVPMFKNLETLQDTKEQDMQNLLDQVHFLPIPIDGLSDHYETSSITPEDYGFLKGSVPTVAVRAVLVTYDFTLKDTPYYAMRCGQLGALGKALRENLPLLQQTGHAKWKEVSLDRDLPLWRRDKCAWPRANPANQHLIKTPAAATAGKAEGTKAIPPAAPAPERTPLEKELLEILTK